ncbi:MAG: hypothetical protein CL840_09150 [Crocinitomicaceae bacterium]|nr:hypothetical protein [Crocinitomicaceae bacterium]|tara:strand:- start:1628 stop:3313 length:1686 start_codon:yes stop_codon:yes gene_type:complete
MRIPIIILFLLFVTGLHSQLTHEKVQQIHSDMVAKQIEINISQAELNELKEIQQRSINQNVVYPIGKLIPVEIDLMREAEWTYDKYENRIGKLTIHSNGATGLAAYFDDFFLPMGCKFYAYDEEKTEIIGPFTFTDNKKENGFGSGTISGEDLILEVFIPHGTRLLPSMKINNLGYQKDPSLIARGSRDFGDSDDCQVNTACKEGDDWQTQKNAVVRIKMVFGGYEGWCSGTILNNTFQDCTPYILTADHCRHLKDGGVAEESEYANWEFYFNYESTKCRNPSNENSVTKVKLTGCTRKASSKNGGDGDPDFLLLRLNDNIPQIYNPHYAGWDRNGLASTSGVMIHHPAGDIKKISTYTRQVESSEWNANFGRDTHWKVIWSKTSNGFGVSEGGSSGAAMWNQDKRVVGQLTGGSSACEEGNGKGPFNPDYFGKLSAAYHWNLGDSTENLLYWLDFGKANARTIDGINWPCSELPLTREPVTKTEDLIQLFPNPASEEVTVSLEGKSGFHLMVYNVLGNKILDRISSEESVTVDVSDWGKGVYVVYCEGDNWMRKQKLVVQ